jgi:adenylate kinase
VGKGTQGVRLAEATGARHLATGDLLRAARREGTELGRKAQAFMDKGELVPDQLIVDLVSEVLRGLDEKAGVVMDGFPRTIAQADAFESSLRAVGRKVDRVVVLEADDDVIVKRMAGRRSCPQCGSVFNVHFSPPKKEGVCDKCGTALIQRADDDAATVKHRLDVYRRETAPLIAYYEKSRAPMKRIAGDRAVDEVQQALQEAVRS